MRINTNLRISYSPKNTFFSTTNGLFLLHSEKALIKQLLINHSALNSIRGIYKSEDYLYVGSYLGFYKYNLKTKNFKIIKDNFYAYAILPWDADRFLISEETHGLFWYFPHENRFEKINYSTPLYNYERMGTVLYRINDSLVLEGSYRGLRLTNPLKSSYTSLNYGKAGKILASQNIKGILPFTHPSPQKLGAYLVATSVGVFLVDIDKKEITQWNNYWNKDIACHCLLRVGDAFWSGTAGLGIMANNKKGQPINIEWLNKQIKAKFIYSMSQLDHHIFIGTDGGLYILDLKDSAVQTLTELDGLASREFNQAAVFNDGSNLFLGTLDGILYFNKKDKPIKTSVLKPSETLITQVTIDGKGGLHQEIYHLPYLPSQQRKITIPPRNNYFTISFGNLDKNDESIDYYYRLNKHEAWIPLNDKRELTFTQIPPGNYSLQFAKQIEGKELVPDSSSILLDIKPAFWQTLIFKVIMSMILLIIIGLFIYFLLIYIYKEKLLRIRIAKDLHDEIGSGLTRIWLQAQNMEETKFDKIQIAKIKNTSKETLSLMSDVIWSINSNFDTIEELISRMKDFIYRIQDEVNLEIDFKMNGSFTKHKLGQEVRQNFFLVFKELINNCVKHGDNSHNIEVVMSQKGIHLELKITNLYSTTFDHEFLQIQGGMGHHNIMERVKKMKGTLVTEIKNGYYTVVVSV